MLANRAVAWLGALSLNATAPGQGASPAVARFSAHFMAPGDPSHPGDFVLTSVGFVGIFKNGCAPSAVLSTDLGPMRSSRQQGHTCQDRT